MHATLQTGWINRVFRRSGWLLIGLTLMLGGCASVIRLENEVQTYARWPAGAVPASGNTFRLERLPSQAQESEERTQLEAHVAARLGAAGMKQVPVSSPAQWLAEVSARSVRLPYSPWHPPQRRWPGPGLAGRDYVVTGNGQVVPLFPFMDLSPPYYQREVTVVLRDARTGTVAYESRAAHDGPWADAPSLWEALVQAVLNGFPKPPNGPRQVVIEVPR